MQETAYASANTWGRRLEHGFGPNVHILADPWSLTLAARLSHPDTKTPEILDLVEAGFRRLIDAAAEQLPIVHEHHTTRMTSADDPRTEFVGATIQHNAPAVICDIARAGMVPSFVLQRELLRLLDPEGVRVDHLYMQRVHDADGRVTHVDTTGSKIGGPVANATVFIPDPMAATGTSICDALERYADVPGGTARRYVLCHLIVTPEYLRRITAAWPDAHIYALRLDRGTSPADVLSTRPGDDPRETGLNETDYIVPGAGGLGELINNAYV